MCVCAGGLGAQHGEHVLPPLHTMHPHTHLAPPPAHLARPPAHLGPNQPPPCPPPLQT